jgi:hypothetical protein
MTDTLTELPDETRLVGVAECDRCGADVELWADAEEWQQQDDGSWKVTGFGPGQGVCCDLLYADWWEGTFVFDLRTEQPHPEGGDR